MKRFTDWLEKYLSGPMLKLAGQRHLVAVRDGMVSAIPFIIVGSFFLILAAPPLPDGNFIREWIMQYSFQIALPFRVTTFVMTLYVAYGIGHSLARSYDLDTLTGGQLALVALLMTNLPFIGEGYGWVMPLANLGGAGMFVTIITSLLAVEVLRFCKVKNLTIKMPESVPAGIARSFAALFPAAIVISAMTIITIVFGIDLHSIMARVFAPLVVAGDSLIGVLVLVFLICFVWSFGIHGMVIATVARPFWVMYAEANMDALAMGATLPHVAPETFYQWFIWIGGSGATLALIFAAFLVGRSKYIKILSKASIVPGLFNINEPIIFGMPIVLNPILIIPFMIAPMVMAVIAWFATTSGIVSPTAIVAPWTLPAPIGAFISTNGDWMAVILGIVNIAIATVIYIPFVKVYDKTLLAQELEVEQEVPQLQKTVVETF